jgi:hypothetical protein
MNCSSIFMRLDGLRRLCHTPAMSMTITLDDAGLAKLGEFVRRRFAGSKPAQVEVEDTGDGVLLKSQVADARETDDVPMAQIEYRDGKPYIVASPPVSASDIVRAIKESREERTDRIIRRIRGS